MQVGSTLPAGPGAACTAEVKLPPGGHLNQSATDGRGSSRATRRHLDNNGAAGLAGKGFDRRSSSSVLRTGVRTVVTLYCAAASVIESKKALNVMSGLNTSAILKIS